MIKTRILPALLAASLAIPGAALAAGGESDIEDTRSSYQYERSKRFLEAPRPATPQALPGPPRPSLVRVEPERYFASGSQPFALASWPPSGSLSCHER